MWRRICWLLALTACSSTDEPPPVEPDLSPLGGERPVEPLVPEGFDPTVETPLVILLHGFGASGAANDLLFGFGGEVDTRNFVLLRPDGTIDPDGKRFWNANDFCCDRHGAGIDDVAYIAALIDEAQSRYAIARVSLIGHSNGAHMAHRFGCDRASSIDAFASIAGSLALDASVCQPDDTVAVLQINGSEDPDVLFDGDMGEQNYPSALENVARWAGYNGCDATPESAANEDYSRDAEGAETEVTRHAGCDEGGHAELWHLVGEGHLPAFSEHGLTTILDHLLGD